ncbi:MAG: tetratricopeptide repeat protein [Verrucomicrobiota bacterium JB022]|nr:tetratricopeptide repeat protein [Verrucomicrobiota bacterium JB022]
MTPDVRPSNVALQRAQQLLELKRYRDAAEEAGRALEADPQCAEALCVIASSYIGIGEIEEAFSAACDAISLDPNNAGALYTIGWIQAKREEYLEAEETLHCALALNPWNAQIIALLAIVSLNLRKLDDAEYFARSALAEDPTLSNARIALIHSLQEKQNIAAAEVVLRDWLKLAPEDVDGHLQLGALCLKNHRHPEAVGAFGEALRINPLSRDATKGLITAIKNRHLTYRLLTRLGTKLSGQSALASFIVPAVMSLFLMMGLRELVPFDANAAVFASIFGFCCALYTGVAMWPACTNLLLLTRPERRYLVHRYELLHSAAIAATFLAGVIAFVAGVLLLQTATICFGTALVCFAVPIRYLPIKSTISAAVLGIELVVVPYYLVCMLYTKGLPPAEIGIFLLMLSAFVLFINRLISRYI